MQIWFLTIIRFLVLLVIGFLLLKPIIKYNKTRLQKPLVLFAIDNSASMVLNSDSVFVTDSLVSHLRNFTKENTTNVDFKFVSFGDSVSFDEPDFNDIETNYEQLFNEFNSTFFNQNIGAMVLISDGIYNKGINPKYASQNISFPIYTVPIGDSTIKADAMVKNIEHNAVVYMGSNFPVDVGIQTQMLKNKAVNVEIYRNNKLLKKQTQQINTHNFYNKLSFNLSADSAGLFKYDVKVSTTSKESNIQNNTKSFYIEVEAEKRKVLIIQNGYHPDVSVFKSVVDQNPAFEVELRQVDDLNINYQKYAIAVLHQLPSSSNNMQKIIPNLVENNIPMLFVIGNASNLQALNNLDIGFKINHKTNLFDEVLPYYNPDFNLFNTTVSDMFIMELPPLNVPFGNYDVFPSSQVLFYQQIGNIQSAKPLWAFSDNGKQKNGFIFGEGIWKWRIQEYRKFKNHSITNELVMKSIQYLATKKQQKTFLVEHLNVYNKNQAIEIGAELYNASNELVKNAEIKLNLTDESGHVYPHFFKEFEQGYMASLGLLNSGKYKFKAQTNYNNKEFIKNGTFIVNENQIEKSNLIANYTMLSMLSEKTGGKLFEKDRINDLFYEVNNNQNINSIKYTEQTLFEIIDLKILLFILITVLVLEWFFRKYWGLI